MKLYEHITATRSITVLPVINMNFIYIYIYIWAGFWEYIKKLRI